MWLLLAVASARASTLTVDASGAATYTTIADAVYAATSGDTIEVAPGTYFECVDFGGKSLTLVGTGGSGVTEIAAGGSCDHALMIQSVTAASVSGFKITNPGYRAITVTSSTVDFDDIDVEGSGGNTGTAPQDHAVHLSSSTVDFRDLTVDGAGAPLATGLYATDTALSIDGGTITDVLGAALYITTSSTAASAELDSVELTSAEEGLGIYNATVATTGCTISDNSTTYGKVVGVSVYGKSATWTSTDDVVDDNTSTTVSSSFYSSQIRIDSYATATLDGTTVSNGYGYYGAAIYVVGSSQLTMIGGSISQNTATQDGAIYLESKATASFTHTDFSTNTAGQGAGIYGKGSNKVTVDGGAFSGNYAYEGAAIYLDNATSLTVSNATFEDNEGSAGSAHGGAIYQYLGTLSIADSTFDANFLPTSNSSGGAVYASGVVADIEGSTFTNNSAALTAGALSFLYSTATVGDSVFDSNSASKSSGGAVYLYGGSLSVSGTTFTDNTAPAGNGGAVAWDPVSTVKSTFTSDTFTGNSAAAGGAIYSGSASNLTVSKSSFVANSSTSASHAGALELYHSLSTAIDNTRFCGNSGDRGGAIYLAAATTTSDTWTNLIFQENSATDGGAVYMSNTSYATLTNITFVGNEATDYGGAVYFDTVKATFLDNIIAYTSAGDGLYAKDATSGTYVRVTYSDWYSNSSTDASGYFSFSTSTYGNVTKDPGFADYTLDGDCTNDSLALATGSALIDAGSTSSSYDDVDGSRADMGAYGGPADAWSDDDADGWMSDLDCDDADATSYPGATEACDGVDNDCDGTVDDTAGTTWYADADADGYGSTTSTTSCSAPTGYVATSTDCDDGAASVNPGAIESCDGVDDDCDGSIDEGVKTTFYVDTDGDGYGGTATVDACSAPTGYVATSTDCDDASAAVSPGATEICTTRTTTATARSTRGSRRRRGTPTPTATGMATRRPP